MGIHGRATWEGEAVSCGDPAGLPSRGSPGGSPSLRAPPNRVRPCTGRRLTPLPLRLPRAARSGEEGLGEGQGARRQGGSRSTALLPTSILHDLERPPAGVTRFRVTGSKLAGAAIKEPGGRLNVAPGASPGIRKAPFTLEPAQRAIEASVAPPGLPCGGHAGSPGSRPGLHSGAPPGLPTGLRGYPRASGATHGRTGPPTGRLMTGHVRSGRVHARWLPLATIRGHTPPCPHAPCDRDSLAPRCVP